MRWETGDVLLTNRKVVKASLMWGKSGNWAIRAPYRHSEYWPEGKWSVALRGTYDLVRCPTLVLAARVMRVLDEIDLISRIGKDLVLSNEELLRICDNFLGWPVVISVGDDAMFGSPENVKTLCEYKIAFAAAALKVPEESAYGWNMGMLYAN